MYELTISLTDGTEKVRPFNIDEYDLRAGSNLYVEVGEEISVPMQE